MNGSIPDVGISVVPEIPENSFDDFIDEIQSSGLDIRIDQHDIGPYAAPEWFIPTAVVLYITKSYFDGVLGEMGKEHYPVFKRAVQRLWQKVFANDDVVRMITLVGSAGKIRSKDYTLKFSVLAQTKDGRVLKLMLKDKTTEDEYNRAINAFLSFLERHHRADENCKIPEGLSLNAFEKYVFVAYDSDSNQLRFLDSVPAEVREKLANKGIRD